MTDPTVAVVVPLRNEIGLLPAARQRWLSLGADELLVVDGGSVDGSREYLQDSGLKWLATGAGRARQMNAGAAVCNSDIIVFLHVDTVVSSSDILVIREAMQDASVAGGRFDVRLDGQQMLLRIVERFINWRSRLTRISTGDQAIFVRREVFERLGGFPELPLMEDVEFSRRLKRQGRIACLKRAVTTSSRRWEKHGILRTVMLMWWLRLLYWLGVPAQRLAAMYRETR